MEAHAGKVLSYLSASGGIEHKQQQPESDLFHLSSFIIIFESSSPCY